MKQIDHIKEDQMVERKIILSIVTNKNIMEAIKKEFGIGSMVMKSIRKILLEELDEDSTCTTK